MTSIRLRLPRFVGTPDHPGEGEVWVDMTLGYGAGYAYVYEANTVRRIFNAGGGNVVVRQISTTVTDTDANVHTLVGVQTTPVEVQLTTPVGIVNKVVTIKDETGAAAPGSKITFNQNIDGSSSFAIDSAYGSVDIYSNNANWLTK